MHAPRPREVQRAMRVWDSMLLAILVLVLGGAISDMTGLIPDHAFAHIAPLCTPLILVIALAAMHPQQIWSRVVLGDDPSAALQYLDADYLRELDRGSTAAWELRDAIRERGDALPVKEIVELVRAGRVDASTGSRLADPLPACRGTRPFERRALVERIRRPQRGGGPTYEEILADWREHPILSALEPAAPIADAVTRLVARHEGEVARWDAVALCRAVQRERLAQLSARS